MKDNAMTLSVEHYGRPFNCWRHGNKKFEAFQKDVEGVLRSSGSFKPHSQTQQGTTRVIGRFGLGFKSVYLLTDTPSVFSGGWNFQIKDGCLPFVVGRPANLPPLATRISLPLLDPDLERPDDAGATALCLLPFLSQTEQISIIHSNGRAAVARCSVEELQPPRSDGPLSEVVTIALSDHGTSREVRLIRVREHATRWAVGHVRGVRRFAGNLERWLLPRRRKRAAIGVRLVFRFAVEICPRLRSRRFRSV